MTTTFWHKSYVGTRTDILTFTDDLMTGAKLEEPEKGLDFHVIDLSVPEALYRVASLSGGNLQLTSFAKSELRNLIEMYPDPTNVQCLVNRQGRTVLVDGVSRGWATIVRFDDFYDILCHDSLKTVCNYLAFVAARHRVRFPKREVYEFFYPMNDVPQLY